MKSDARDVPTLAPGSQHGTVEERLSFSDQFGDYELIEELARGGMGVVYRAKQLSLNREVAVKMILSGRFASEQEVRRFRHEAESAANLDHASIVPIYEVGEHEGNHYFTMKLVEGGSLADHLLELQSNHQDAAKLISKVARAVHHAHQRGILHRDLKPANILIDESGEPLVTDLGLARDTQSADGLTQTGAVLGTPAYMPPEQASGKETVTTAADIYSIGAILYEALTGQPPHVGQTPMETLLKATQETPRPPRDLNRNIDITLELICQKCLRHDPNQRYSSAAALADDLENWVAGEPVSVRPQSFSQMVGATLRSSLKSALGAAFIGLFIGGLLTCLAWIGMSDVQFLRRLAWTFNSFPSESKPEVLIWLHNTAYQAPAWLEGVLAVLFIVSYVMVGVICIRLVKPRRGAHAFAISVVCGLVMTTAIYAILGFVTMYLFSTGPISRDVYALTKAVYGSQDEQQEATQELAERHPDIPTLKTRGREPKWSIGNLIVYRAMAGIPTGIVAGIFLSAIIGMLPPILGTTFASRVFDEEKPRHALMLYFELMLALFVLAYAAFFQAMLEIGGPNIFQDMSFEVRPRQSYLPGLVVGFVAVYAVYHRWDWRIRLGLFIAAVVVRNAFLVS